MISFFTSGVSAIGCCIPFHVKYISTVQEASRFESREITFSLDKEKFTRGVWISEIEAELPLFLG
jgi:hypothetical protein